jgi:GTP cyclohydrolase II
MSNMKHDAITSAGIEIGERVPIPPDLVPPDASVELEAKKAAGYYAPDAPAEDLSRVIGRDLKDF